MGFALGDAGLLQSTFGKQEQIVVTPWDPWQLRYQPEGNRSTSQGPGTNKLITQDKIYGDAKQEQPKEAGPYNATTVPMYVSVVLEINQYLVTMIEQIQYKNRIDKKIDHEKGRENQIHDEGE